MKPIVTPQHMANLDQYAIDTMVIPGLILMENAGRGIAKVAIKMLEAGSGKRVHIYCGPGNNGGDGFVVARHLLNHGYHVDVFILASREKIKRDSLTNLVVLEKMGQPLQYIDKLPAVTHKPALIIDALLGTGANSPVKGLFAEIVEYINEMGVPVLAVDIPTGINAETGSVSGPAIKAQITCTMGLLKSGLLLAPASIHAGQVQVIDISLPAQALLHQPGDSWLVEPEDVVQRLPRRPIDAHKNLVGTVAVVAGSLGFCGAAALSSMACLRSGVGLCYLAIPKSLHTVMAAKLTEVVLWPFEDQQQGFLSGDCSVDLLQKIKMQNACAIGPGLGQVAPTAQMLFSLLAKLTIPMVLDADGLNICSGKTDAIKNYQGEMVLTPHPGELARLLGITTQAIAGDRMALARRTAQELGKVVVLKGGPTLIASPDGQLFVNPTGNAGMATAGSGDVLTGVISAMLAQGLKAVDAALVGVYVHGLAGDLAKTQFGEISLVAGDILAKLADAFMTIKRS